MSRTENQRKGDAGEELAMAQDWWDGYEIDRGRKNQAGCDYKRRRRKCCVRVN